MTMGGHYQRITKFRRITKLTAGAEKWGKPDPEVENIWQQMLKNQTMYEMIFISLSLSLIDTS